MEKKKWNCLDYILRGNNKKTLHNYADLLRARSQEAIMQKTSKWTKMSFIHTCFIMMFLYRADWMSHDLDNTTGENHNEIEQLDLLEYCFVAHDFLLINNQIPFFILKRIYELFTNEENATMSLLDKAATFVEEILCNYPKAIKESERPKHFDHLLHLCHLYIRSTQKCDYFTLKLDLSNQYRRWHRAVQYHIAGIKLAKREIDENIPHSLLDVKFSNNLMEIPCLPIDENTKNILKNLIALEQTSIQYGNDVTSYVVFMSQLIGNSKDVAFLVSKGIIEHPFESDEEVLHMFMELSEGITFNFYFEGNYYLKNIYQNLDVNYQSHVKSWKGWLRRTGFAIRGWV